MSQAQPRPSNPLRRAIGKLVTGLEKQEQMLQERRRHKRFPFGVKVTACVPKKDGTYETIAEVWITDISMGGVGLLSQRTFEADAIIYLNFETLLKHSCYMPVKVCNTRPLIGDVLQVHCQFYYPDEHLLDGDGIIQAA